MLARRKQEVSGCVRRRLCGVLSTLPLEHNRFYGRVRSHQHHTLEDKESEKTGMLFDAFHSTLLESEGDFLACFINSDVLVSRDTSLDDPRCKSNLCKNPWLRCNCNWPPCTWCSLLAKTKALSMSSPSQPGSTVSLSTSCEIGSPNDVAVKLLS